MDSPSLRIIFAGTPAFAASHLTALLASQHQVVAVYTQPDRPAGRGKKAQAGPVKQVAESAGVPVYQPVSLKEPAAQAQLADLQADLMIVVAYGLILPQAVLDSPRFGCINVHASLLPRWRGAAPIQRAIAAGDTSSGITIMQMDAGLDTGAMLAVSSCPIGPQCSAGELHDRLASAGVPLLLEVLSDLPHYRDNGQTQDDEQATYAHKILKPEAEIDWSLSACQLHRAVLAFNPFPVCYTYVDGQRLKIWQADIATMDTEQPAGTILAAGRDGIIIACGQGALRIQRLQLPGGKTLSVEQILNAKRALFAPGNRLGES